MMKYWISQILTGLGGIGFLIMTTLATLIFDPRNDIRVRSYQTFYNYYSVIAPLSAFIFFTGIFLSLMYLNQAKAITPFGQQIREYGRFGLYTLGILILITSIFLIHDVLNLGLISLKSYDMILLLDLVLFIIFLIGSWWIIIKLQADTNRETHIRWGFVITNIAIILYLLNPLLNAMQILIPYELARIVPIVGFVAWMAGLFYTNYQVRQYNLSVGSKQEKIELYTEVK